MNCPKCGSSNVTTQIVSDIEVKDAHRGIFWWLFVGWWWIPIKWLVFTLPALILAIFAPKKKKIKSTQRTVCICQACGNTWDLR